MLCKIYMILQSKRTWLGVWCRITRRLFLAEKVRFLRAVGRQEHAVEREASWGIAKLRVDGGHVIDVGEVLALAALAAVATGGAGAGGMGTKRAGARLCETTVF